MLAALATWRRLRTLVAPLTLLRVGCAIALTTLISAQISAAGPWLVAKLAALLAVWLMMLVLLRELTLANLEPFAIWHRGAADRPHVESLASVACLSASTASSYGSGLGHVLP